ncbi:MAG TPA: metallophosphoesterase, partial [Archangium sp.]|uniref:metallophosphoesterase n=1 Tax=Archangium sp. TaxID=1872627 RepID=UPI002EDAFD96
MGARSSRLLRPEYREAFEQDLRRMHARSGPWDLVLISGDLTLTGSAREFAVLQSTLSSLWSYLRGLGSDPCLLVVPGNHDFEQGQHLAWNANTVVRYQHAEVRKALRGSGASEIARHIRGGLHSFNEWFNAWRKGHPSSVLQGFRDGLLPGDFCATVASAGLKVGVVGLNSSFWSDTAALYELDLEQVEVATGLHPRGWAHGHDLVLLLTHHPPSMLRSKGLERVHEALTPSSGLLLHLCGSGNKEEGAYTRGPSGRSVVIQASSLFSGMVVGGGDEGAWSRWGYTVGVLDGAGTGERLRLFPRIASSTKGATVMGPDERGGVGPDEALEMPLSALGRRDTQDAAHASLLEMLGSDSDASDLPTPRLPPGVKLQRLLDTGREAVAGLAWAPAGDALGIGLASGALTYWKLAKDVPKWMISAHLSEVVDLSFSPDGKSLAARSRHHVSLLPVAGSLRKTPMALVTEGQWVDWSSRGLLVTDREQGSLQFWSTRTGTQVGRARIAHGPRELYSLAWSPDGRVLACGGKGPTSLVLLRVTLGGDSVLVHQLAGLGLQSDVLEMAWMPGSSRLALACRGGTLHIWDTERLEAVAVLEGHRGEVANVTFSFDGRLLASKSSDGSIRVWRTDTWEPVAEIEEPVPSPSSGGLVFSPTKHVLASPGPGGRGVLLLELDLPTLLRSQAPAPTVHEVSAKVVLVGEGRAGKSCVALRMVKDEYEELDSTHGMRFWSLPAEPSSATGGTSGVQREIILWDLGGQSEYQLVHQLFLRDSTVALMMMEPGRGERALEEIEGWNRRLLAQSGERNIRKLLVGTKVDNAEAPVNHPALEGLVQRLGFESYVLTSAKKGQGIPELKEALGRAIDWDSLEKVSRPELFQCIRELIQRLREAKRVVLTFFELESELRRELGSSFEPEALQAVVGHLTRQGRVADTRMAGGTRVLILEVEQLERYAGSLIVAARENPHGVPAIEVAKVLSPKMKFPRIKPEERLTEDQELAVLSCVIELLIEHGVCLRHEGLLIFPSLFQP